MLTSSNKSEIVVHCRHFLGISASHAYGCFVQHSDFETVVINFCHAICINIRIAHSRCSFFSVWALRYTEVQSLLCSINTALVFLSTGTEKNDTNSCPTFLLKAAITVYCVILCFTVKKKSRCDNSMWSSKANISKIGAVLNDLLLVSDFLKQYLVWWWCFYRFDSAPPPPPHPSYTHFFEIYNELLRKSVSVSHATLSHSHFQGSSAVPETTTTSSPYFPSWVRRAVEKTSRTQAFGNLGKGKQEKREKNRDCS